MAEKNLPKDLTENRKEIDRIDQKILNLIHERSKLVINAADAGGSEITLSIDVSSITGSSSTSFVIAQVVLDNAVSGLPSDFVIKKLYAYADLNGDGVVNSDPHSSGLGMKLYHHQYQ